MRLNELTPAEGSKKKSKRVGRGPGSGHGKTACKGHKGQKSRSGGGKGPGFEGGQMPLIRRVPKRGFRNLFKKEYAIVNLKDLERLSDIDLIDPDILMNEGLIKGYKDGVKILGEGNIERAITCRAHKFSKTAQGKILSAGGRIELIGGR